jgi:hypothetical protein
MEGDGVVLHDKGTVVVMGKCHNSRANESSVETHLVHDPSCW